MFKNVLKALAICGVLIAPTVAPAQSLSVSIEGVSESGLRLAYNYHDDYPRGYYRRDDRRRYWRHRHHDPDWFYGYGHRRYAPPPPYYGPPPPYYGPRPRPDRPRRHNPDWFGGNSR